jgi:hypothetical protein
MSTAQTKAAHKSTKALSNKTAKPKKSALKNSFIAVHGVCPELVNLFDYMVDQSTHGTRDVTLRQVEHYAKNIQETLAELLDLFGPDTPLSEIEHMDEIDDLF